MPFGINKSEIDVTVVLFERKTIPQDLNEIRDVEIYFTSQIPAPLLEELREFWLEHGYHYDESDMERGRYKIAFPISIDRAEVAERVCVAMEMNYGLKVKRIWVSMRRDDFFEPTDQKSVQSFLFI